VVALVAGLRQLTAALQIRVVALVVRGFLGDDRLTELLADGRESLADLRVAEGLDLGFEIVGLVDERLDPLQLTVVRVDEPGKKSKHGARSIRSSPRQPSSALTGDDLNGLEAPDEARSRRASR